MIFTGKPTAKYVQLRDTRETTPKGRIGEEGQQQHTPAPAHPLERRADDLPTNALGQHPPQSFFGDRRERQPRHPAFFL